MNRYWRLDRHPDGNDFAAAFSLVEGPLRSPADGEVLVQNQYLSLDAGTRLWMTSRTDGYQPPLPLGEPIKGLVLGEVVTVHIADWLIEDGVYQTAKAEPILRVGRGGDYLRVIQDCMFEMERPAGSSHPAFHGS